jgi:hypothetical protein
VVVWGSSSYSWKFLQVGLVIGGTGLDRFGFGKTATLLVCGGGVMNEAVGPVRCLSYLCWVYFHFPSQGNLHGASIPLSKAFRSRDFSLLRRRCVLLVLDLVDLRGWRLFLRLVYSLFIPIP